MNDINPFEVLTPLGVNDCTRASRVHGGWDTTIWKVERRDEAFALRLFNPGRDRGAALEVATMREAAAAGIPVPAVHAEGTWEGRPALLLSWCPGRTLMQEVRSRPWAIRKLGYQFGQMHASMHAKPFPSVEIEHEDWISSFGPVDDELRDRLTSIAPQANRLLHFDYHPLNVMVSDRHISCILDWANAMPGDPRADVARTWSILRLLPLTPFGPEPVTEIARRHLAAGWLRGYQDTAEPLTDMVVFKAWAGMVLIHDMSPRLDNPEFWIKQHHIDAIQDRVNELRHQAGLPAWTIPHKGTI